MATDGNTPRQPSEDDMLPDEREVIAERAADLDDLDEDDFLSVEEIADQLDIELD